MKSLRPSATTIDAALVDELHADGAGKGGWLGCAEVARAQRVADLLLDAAVEQGIPADDEVVEVAAFVAEVAVGRPAALAVELCADDHVHAAVDGPVELLADDEALDGRVAEDGNQQSALAAGLVDRMAQVGQIEDGHAEELEKGVGGGGRAVVEIDGAGDDAASRAAGDGSWSWCRR